MINTSEVSESLKAKNDIEKLKNITLFAIDELKENISDESKELYNDYKRLVEYIINLKTITIVEKKQKIRDLLNEFEKKIYTDLNDTKYNIEEFEKIEKKFSNQNLDGDNVFISKKVINKGKIILVSKYFVLSTQTKVTNGISKVLKKHGV